MLGALAVTTGFAVMGIIGAASTWVAAAVTDVLGHRRRAWIRRVGSVLVAGVAAIGVAVVAGGSVASALGSGAVVGLAGHAVVRGVPLWFGGRTPEVRALRELRVRLALLHGFGRLVTWHYRMSVRPTEAESEVLRGYIRDAAALYAPLNAWLRGGSFPGGDPAPLATALRTIVGLFARYRLPVAIRVNRTDGRLFLLPRYPIGSTFTDAGVVSTSIWRSPLDRQVDMTILVPAGTEVIRPLGVGAPRDEREVMLPPGTRFMVLADRRGSRIGKDLVERRIALVAVPPVNGADDPALTTPEAVAVLARHGVDAWRLMEPRGR